MVEDDSNTIVVKREDGQSGSQSIGERSGRKFKSKFSVKKRDAFLWEASLFLSK